MSTNYPVIGSDADLGIPQRDPRAEMEKLAAELNRLRMVPIPQYEGGDAQNDAWMIPEDHSGWGLVYDDGEGWKVNEVV